MARWRMTRMRDGERRLIGQLEAAHDRSLAQVLVRAKAIAPKLTGEYAAGLKVERRGEIGVLYSDLPQAGAVERGAFMRGGQKGPHMRGKGVMKRAAGRQWLRHMSEDLRSHG